MGISLSSHDIRQVERLARDHAVTAAEVFEIMMDQIATDLDPLDRPTGPLFVFERPHTVDERYFDNAAVPRPDAAVDVLGAWEITKRDIGIAAWLLDEYPTKATGRSVAKNALAWFKFWAARGPTQAFRTKYRALALIWEARFQLAEKGKSNDES